MCSVQNLGLIHTIFLVMESPKGDKEGHKVSCIEGLKGF